DPRICDIAGHILNRLAPDKYPFDLEASLQQRDCDLIKLKNIWRHAHGQEAQPLPSPRVVPVVSEEKLAAPLQQFLYGSDKERKEAEAQIEQLGLGALPSVARHANAPELTKAQRAALDQLTRRLASIVAEVVIADESLPLEPALKALLEAMKGK